VQPETYSRRDSFWFTKITDPAGVLSNMNALAVTAGGRKWSSTEALYQACRFPDHQEVQELIWSENSPMAAKLRSKSYRKTEGCGDWGAVQIPVMEWCLWLKLAFNFRFVYWPLRQNADRPLVEISARRKPRETDLLWGTGVSPADPDSVTGCNVLGKLWMIIRSDVLAPQPDGSSLGIPELTTKFSVVPAPPVPRLILFGQPVGEIVAGRA